MLITTSLTKKKLEELIKYSFQFLTFSQAANLGDSLKGIGFYYATASGASISLEDLKTPKFKKQLIEEIENDFENISRNWALGMVSDAERFQSILESWHNGAENLRKQIIEHFRLNDPLNALYIMAFSGARGNMSQVRQVIGMRGLMVNQGGDIIDIPIQTNFREGLSAIDYIVASYGARKGVVDTALKTADAGYLTRRLIYSVQEIVVKTIDCGTDSTQSAVLSEVQSENDIIGKTFSKFINFKGETFKISLTKNTIITQDLIAFLKKQSFGILFYRSPLNCKIKDGICQTCYGWDSSKFEKIDLGLAVGIIAAQSIGEPGTQLTMRTFHTGGIFTGKFLEYQITPDSGKLELPLKFESKLVKTSSGKNVPLLLEDIFIKLTSWKGTVYSIFLPRSSFLHVSESTFVKKGQIISELQKKSKIISDKKKHPLCAPFDGLAIKKKLSIRIFKQKKLKATKIDSYFWLVSGRLYEIPQNAKFLSKKFLTKQSAFALCQITCPTSGIIVTNEIEKKISIINNSVQAELFLDQLANLSSVSKIKLIIKNCSFLDAHSVIAFAYYYPEVNEKIFRVKKSPNVNSNYKKFLFFITEKDIWKVYYDTSQRFLKQNEAVFSGDLLSPTLEATSSGIVFENNGLQNIYQKAIGLRIPAGTILSSFKGKFVKKNKVLAYFLLAKQKGEDIVQGLPKIETLLEARKIKKSALLLSFPSVLLGNWLIKKVQIIENFSNSKSIQNSIFKLTISPYSEKFFNLFSKIRKLSLNKSDKRSLRRFERKHYFLINFFKNSLNSKFLLNLTKKKCFIKDKESLFLYLNPPRFPRLEQSVSFTSKKIFKKFSQEIASPLFSNIKKVKHSKMYPSAFSYTPLIFLKKDNVLRAQLIKANSNTIENFNFNYSHFLKSSLNLKSHISEFLEIGRTVTNGKIDAHALLSAMFNYHSNKDGFRIGALKSSYKLQLILLNSIQSIYTLQGVEIFNIHIELILRALTSKVCIIFSHGGLFYLNETISLLSANELAEIYQLQKKNAIIYKPILLPISKVSLHKEGFLGAAGFQETKFILTKAAIEGKKDWLKGLKESIMIGRLIPAGSGFLNTKNYLDTLFYYKTL